MKSFIAVVAIALAIQVVSSGKIQKRACQDQWTMFMGVMDCMEILEGMPMYGTGQCATLREAVSCLEGVFQGCTQAEMNAMDMQEAWDEMIAAVDEACP